MQKRTVIKNINKIITEFGSFTTGDVQAESSPCINSMANSTQLAEKFYVDKADTILYDKKGNEIDEDVVYYKDMEKDVLEEILFLAEQYEADQIQTEKRISN
jgi:hypothetical protein